MRFLFLFFLSCFALALVWITTHIHFNTTVLHASTFLVFVWWGGLYDMLGRAFGRCFEREKGPWRCLRSQA